MLPILVLDYDDTISPPSHHAAATRLVQQYPHVALVTAGSYIPRSQIWLPRGFRQRVPLELWFNRMRMRAMFGSADVSTLKVKALQWIARFMRVPHHLIHFYDDDPNNVMHAKLHGFRTRLVSTAADLTPMYVQNDSVCTCSLH
uniref:FCP1 homology domain-containing protein n=1 Tax=viral metagenome TaxID=1070528 RepID=A0A6C0BQ90_9ZZZZ